MEPWTLENGVPSGESGTFPTYFSEFNRGANVAEVAKIICTVYGDNTTGESTTRKWFSRFKEDSFDTIDTPSSGRPSGFDEDRLNALIHNDPCQCTRKLANALNCDHFTIVPHLHSLCKVNGCSML